MLDSNASLAGVRKQIYDEILEPVNEAIADAVMTGFNFAINKSPVWTGRFRSAWAVSVNRASRSNPPLPSAAFRRSHPRGTDAYSSELSATRNRANKSMDNFDVEKHYAVHISNNVPYGIFIENGGRNITGIRIAARTEALVKKMISQNLRKIL